MKKKRWKRDSMEAEKGQEEKREEQKSDNQMSEADESARCHGLIRMRSAWGKMEGNVTEDDEGDALGKEILSKTNGPERTGRQRANWIGQSSRW